MSQSSHEDFLFWKRKDAESKRNKIKKVKKINDKIFFIIIKYTLRIFVKTNLIKTFPIQVVLLRSSYLGSIAVPKPGPPPQLPHHLLHLLFVPLLQRS